MDSVIHTRSAGGQIILELLGNSFPTTCLYVSDTSRCTSPRYHHCNFYYYATLAIATFTAVLCCAVH